MILVLDDNPRRHMLFRRGLTGAPLVAVTTAQEAIASLGAPGAAFTAAFLDYDLDQFGLPESAAGNGLEVAEWVAEHAAAFPRTAFVIHSLNRASARCMYDIMRRAGLRVSLSPGVWELDHALEAIALRDQQQTRRS